MTSNILTFDFIIQYKDRPTPMNNYGLGEFIYKRTYSRVKPKADGTFDDTCNDYEEWYETIERVVNGAFKIKKNHYLKNNIEWDEEKERNEAEKMYDKMFNVKFLPGGRSLWAMGTKITDEKGLFTALNNCAGCSTKYNKENPAKPFEFLFDACMLGVGVGFDTKGIDIPLYAPMDDTIDYVIEDSREGWVKALHELLNSYFKPNQKRVIFDYSKIRPAGQLLKTFGGTSSGYEPLKKSFDMITDLLDKAVKEINHMTSKLIVSVMNIICLAVISGNVRRSATIALGQYNDEEFINLKDYEKNPERISYGWLSNNSIDAVIGMDYSKVSEGIKLNGEPGLLWMDNARKYGRMNGVIDNKDKDAVIVNPCMTYDTKLLTNKGYIVLGENVGKIVNVWNGEKWTPAEIKMTGHNREVFKCTFNDGSYNICTPNHKFILKNGTEKEIQDLMYDDVLQNSNCIRCDDEGIELDDAYDRGFFCGDDTYKVPGDYDKNFVPLYGFSLNTRLNYLSGIFDSNGNLSFENNIGYIRLHSVNYDYLYNVKLLINSLGIYCNFNKQYDEKNKALYEINITNDQIIKLIDLGLNTHRLQINKLTKSSENYEKQIQLKSVEHYGYADVYCVTTLDDSHKAVFNGILSHNCGEQTLHDFELCNLVEIFINRSEGYDDFIDTLKYAFMYAKIVSLCETQWEDTNKIIRQNRRVGCSLTGIVNFLQDKGIEELRKYTTNGYNYLKNIDKEISKEMKINESIKITCVKPSGTISLLVPGTCPGIHYPLSKYYIRRVRVNINHKKLLDSMISKGYKVEKSETEPYTMVVNFPIDIKSNRCISDVSMWEQLELCAKLSEWWADNQVSCTIMFDPRTEGQDIQYALDMYQYRLKGISFLPTFKHIKQIENPKIQKYPQMPFEEITKSEYELLSKNVKAGNIQIDSNAQEEEMFCTTDTCILRSIKRYKTNIIFMNGLAGSGKSFVAKKMMTYLNNQGYTCKILSKDDFRYIDGKYIFDREYEKVVEEKYFNTLQETMKENLNYLILDNTHIGNDFVNKTLQYIIGHKMTMICIKPFSDLDKHIKYNIHIDEKDKGRIKYQKNNWEINYPLYQIHKVLYEKINDKNFDNNMIEKIIDDTIKYFNN